jgi:fatty acid synthase subunit beta, fungi type
MGFPGLSSSTSSAGEATPSTPATLLEISRLTLEHGDTRWALQVEPDEELCLRMHFENFRVQQASQRQESINTGEKSKSHPLFLASEFLQFLLDQKEGETSVKTIVREIQRQFLQDADIHSVVSTLDEKAQINFLKSYYTALSFTQATEEHRPSALLGCAHSSNVNVYAIFGGQGSSNKTCLRELRDLRSVYKPLLDELLQLATDVLSNLFSNSQSLHLIDTPNFDLKTWLEQPETAPEESKIAAAPLSFPLIGLLSLSHFVVTCKVLGKTPGKLRDSLQGVTGHSQGVIIAAVIAASSSWDSFYKLARFALSALFWIGAESHREMKFLQVPLAASQGCVEQGEGLPSPMLSVRGLDQKSVTKIIGGFNESLTTNERVYLALINARDNFVIAGPPRSLYGLNIRLRNQRAPDGLDQARIIFNQRKPVIRHEFLPMSAAFHSPYCEPALPRILENLKSFTLTGNELGIGLFHTKSGKDLKSFGNQDIIEPLVRMITSELVDWPCASKFSNASHVIDFGPGRIGSLIQKSAEGMGVRVISATDLRSKSNSVGGKAELFSSYLPPTPLNWEAAYGPQVIKDATGNFKLETRMTRLMGVPPIMVAGMTPTTVPWDFVASVMKAGYHAELAGGGYSSPEHFETAIKNLSADIPITSGITCNIIYASPKVVAWQIPLLRRLNEEGYPIDGLTIGAGVPSAEVVNEYVSSLGLKHISFKPGSRESILQVIQIAKTHPQTTIGLQWTGGRGGGHHSFEDFHQPILETYGKIRECDNIVLIAGSGFGGAEDTLPYLTGEWSLSMDYPRMPFDGVLLGSRMMVAREAHTSPSAKELIVQAEGVSDAEWHTSYEKVTGGVITVTSEMGQPIHKLATRGVLLWKDLDRRIFSITDRNKRLAELQKNKNEIISRLNQDYQKPWFACDSFGFPTEIENMTYHHALRRLVSLMYIEDQSRWIDPSYAKFVEDFVNRIRERFETAQSSDTLNASIPSDIPESFLRAYPNASQELLHPEDVSFFISLCLRRGQKPVNFIPRLDENFETWFKKDSLWQAEDIDAVIGREAQRVCIIHGPVAARYSRVVDEPSKTILDNILNSWTESIAKDSVYLIKESSKNDSNLLVKIPSAFSNVKMEQDRCKKSYLFDDTALDGEAFLDYLGHEVNGWAQACLLDRTIIRGNQRQANCVRKALTPIPHHILSIYYGEDGRVNAVIMSKAGDSSANSNIKVAISSHDGITVKVAFTEATNFNRHTTLEFSFEYHSERGNNRLTEVTENRISKIKTFYSELWLGNYSDTLRDADIHSKFLGEKMKISNELVQNFMRATESVVSSQDHHYNHLDCVPLGICITLAWEALVKPLLTNAIDGDLMQLLHRSNEFKYVEGASPLRIGDIVDSYSFVRAITNTSKGKEVEVCATIQREGEAIVIVKSVFFIQGTFKDHEKTFRLAREPRFQLDIKSEKEYALLTSRAWANITKDKESLIGQSLIFETTTQATYGTDGTFSSLQVTGEVHMPLNGKLQRAGTVFYEVGQCHGNPVLNFLKRHGKPTGSVQKLPNPGWEGESSWNIHVPLNNTSYAFISKDSNPIHVSLTFANFSQLPGTVTHGMLTSEVVRRAVEEAVAELDLTRFRRYFASFEGMVFPGDELSVELQHIGMFEGRLVLKIRARNTETSTLVLEAEAEVEQQTTAYVFTGQGSQEKGMGMTLYEKSPAARAAWDRADKHLYTLFGKYFG